jgi:hypothetical protein
MTMDHAQVTMPRHDQAKAPAPVDPSTCWRQDAEAIDCAAPPVTDLSAVPDRLARWTYPASLAADYRND